MELYPHQKEDSLRMFHAKRMINGSDMGVGKTPTTIQAIKYLKSYRILILCPASLKRNWQVEFERWYPKCPFLILEGSARKREAIMGQFLEQQGVLCANYEQVRARRGEKPKTFLYSEDLKSLLSLGFQTLVCDEAHSMRNRASLQYKGADVLAKQIPNLFLLTGTPIVNRMPDLWPLLHMIDRGKYSSYWKFVDHPVWGCGKEKNVFGGYKVGNASKDPEALKREIAPHFIRRLKEDVLKDLPEKTYQKIWVDLKPDEQRVYDEMEKEWIANLKKNREVAAPVVISQITRLKQFCISPDLAIMPLVEGAEYGHGFNTSKYEVLKEIIEGTDQKIVVFSQFEKAITLGEALCKSLKIESVRHTGKESAKERDEALNKWRCDPNVQVCFLTIASGGVGLNLVEANLCVFLDKPWTIASFDQATDRLHRSGQKSAVTIYELLVRGSVEEWLVEEKLTGKLKLTEEIIQMAERKIKEVQR